MTEVSGSLKLVTGSPAAVSQVWLRAPNGRVQGSEYVTEAPDTIQVTGGAVSFDALPGAMVMTLVSHGSPMHTVKLLVPDKTTATLAECIEAAELATDGTRSALERLALEVQAELGQVPALVSDALAQDSTIIEAVRQVVSSYTGTGSPEGEVSAPVGSTYTDTEATNGAIRWVKTNGTGNTGWHVEYGDTGVRSLPRPEVFDGGIFSVSRNGDYVHLVIHAATLASTLSAWHTFMTLPPGFRTATTFRTQAQDAHLDVRTDGRLLQVFTDLSAGKVVSLGVVYRTNDQWPSTLPGIPS